MVKKQRGVALIIILLLLAVMVSIAASMADRLFTQFKRSTSQINHQQAYWYSIGAEALAKVGLEQSFKDSDTINLSQPWALEEQTYPLDYGTLKGHLVDKQACFNLNALSSLTVTPGSDKSPYLVKVLQNLLQELDIESYQAETIAQSVWEYVDHNDSANSTLGVEDSFYESMSPAYMAANSLIADSSELRAINQVSGEVMEKVRPFVCAIPTSDFRLNVNTIQPEQAGTPFVLLFLGFPFVLFMLFKKEITPFFLENCSLSITCFAVCIGAIPVILSKTVKYALFDPTKEMAYLPLDDEARVKGKAAADAVGGRLGKSGGALIQQGLMVITGLGIAGVMDFMLIFFVLFCLCWIYGVCKLDKSMHQLDEQHALEAKKRKK